MAPMNLEANDIHVYLGTKHVLKGVSMKIDPGERVALIGPNGCGKSTLLRALCGVLPLAKGEILLDGKSLNQIHRRERARQIGLLSQKDVVPAMTPVHAHVGMGRHPHRRWLQGESASELAIIERAMDACAVSHLAYSPVDRLSGGERQRVRMATLLAQDPLMLFLDEPLTGLDLEHQLSVLEMIYTFVTGGKGVLGVLHDLPAAATYFDRVLVMKEGEIVADGPANSVISKELLLDVFAIDASLQFESKSGQAMLVFDHPRTTLINNKSTSYSDVTLCPTTLEIH